MSLTAREADVVKTSELHRDRIDGGEAQRKGVGKTHGDAVVIGHSKIIQRKSLLYGDTLDDTAKNGSPLPTEYISPAASFVACNREKPTKA